MENWQYDDIKNLFESIQWDDPAQQKEEAHQILQNIRNDSYDERQEILAMRIEGELNETLNAIIVRLPLLNKLTKRSWTLYRRLRKVQGDL